MTLEECSKEELIYIIHQLERGNLFHDRGYEFDILMCRKEKCRKEESRLQKESSASLQRYIDILAPYEGQPIGNIPDKLLSEAATAFRSYESYSKKEAQNRREWSRIDKKITEHLAKND